MKTNKQIKENTIPVILSSDSKLFFALSVVIVSMLENADKDTFYEINCLCASDVSDEDKRKLEQLKQTYSNFSLIFYDMGDTFKDLPTTQNYHVNYVSAYKMLIPSMFSHYAKVLYLDTDIIVRDDLRGFYEFAIEDNYLASTPACLNYVDDNTYKYICNLLDLPNLDYYINAGVMLMNLEQIRKDKIDKKWISLLGSYENSIDQHIINKVCYGKTAFMPIKYNVCITDIPFYKSGEVQIFYCQKEIQAALENPSILHWAGTHKPWKFDDVFLTQEWTRYFRKSPFFTNLKREKSKWFVEFYNDIIIPVKKKYYILGIPVFKIKTAFNSMKDIRWS